MSSARCETLALSVVGMSPEASTPAAVSNANPRRFGGVTRETNNSETVSVTLPPSDVHIKSRESARGHSAAVRIGSWPDRAAYTPGIMVRWGVVVQQLRAV